jgi:hypothetical protein
MVFGGIISILIAIWIFRTAREAKTGNTLYWVAGSVVVFLVVQTIMIYFNAMIIEIFDGDVSIEYDNAGGLNARDNSDTAGLQSGTGGTFIGIIFEFLPFIVSFFVIAVLRLLVMLKQPFGFMPLFSGIKETFIGIGDSFKVSDEAAAQAPQSENEDTNEDTKE